jgi:D-alanyl-lipoteichoic acid acyltransferase DltB (MBOAT superfamily)
VTFNSLKFVLFYVVVWGVVACVLVPGTLRRIWPARPDVAELSVALRNGFLLLASYFFYGSWDYRFLGLLALSTALDYGFARAMGTPGQHAARRRKLLITTSVLVNLTILGFFKYYGFFARSFEALATRLGLHVHPWVLEVVLPVGVSFYTFQSLSYTIDVYRGQLAPEPSLLTFATFVAFFPQLVAGPIERATALLPVLRRPTEITWSGMNEGAFLIAAGLFKKVVIADNVSRVADAAFDLGAPTGLQSAMGAYAFAVQIYCDFSGYTDIARGAARCLGFELMLNFDLPYFSRDPSEFWRRWHISLSTWLRDYLYIPLGGNRTSTFGTYRNLMLTMLLGGLWHGAAWTFIAWGAFHGALLCLHRGLRPVLAFIRPARAIPAALYSAVSAIVMFHLVTVGWVFFRAKTLSRAFQMIASLRHVGFQHVRAELAALGPVELAGGLTVVLVLFQLAERASGDLLIGFRAPVPVRAVVYALGTILFFWVGEYGGDAFIYFQF